MILVFGSINVDLVARVATIPGPGKTVLAPSYHRHFGGKGANQAVAAARLAAPGRVAMAACVGDDGFGRESIDNLVANGAAADLVRFGTAPTGCAFITVDAQAENAITVASGISITLVESSRPPRPTSSSTTSAGCCANRQNAAAVSISKTVIGAPALVRSQYSSVS